MGAGRPSQGDDMSHSSQIASYQASVNANYRSIDLLQTRIAELNQKIADVQTIKLRAARRQAAFAQSMHSEQKTMGTVKTSHNVKVAIGYADKMHGYFNGDPYNNANSSFEDVLSELNRVIYDYEDEIEDCRRQIRMLESSITSLNSSISRLRATM